MNFPPFNPCNLVEGKNQRIVVSYPLRFARPPTLGGQSLRNAGQLKEETFSVWKIRMEDGACVLSVRKNSLQCFSSL